MTKTLRVWVHWTDAQNLTNNPIPPSLNSYNAGVWPSTKGNPVWSSNSQVVVDDIVGWCELSDQADIPWNGTLTPPPSGDQGYNSPAIGFKVNEVRLYQNGADNKDYVITLKLPNGQSLPPIIPPWNNGSYSNLIPVNIPNGWGIWIVTINRFYGSSVSAPGLELNSGSGSEPYISLYGNHYEGLLALEFIGEEVFLTPDCCPIVRLETPIVTGQAPNAVAKFVVAPITWNPSGCTPQPAVTDYIWTVKEVVPTNSSTNPTTYTKSTQTAITDTSKKDWTLNGSQTTLQLSPSNTYSVMVKVKFNGGVSSNCDPTDFIPFNVPAPTTSPCPQGSPFDESAFSYSEGACDSDGNRDVTATVKIKQGWTISKIEWSWDGTASVPSSPPTGTTSPSHLLSSGSTHSVVATVTLAEPNSDCKYSFPKTIPVTACEEPPVTIPSCCPDVSIATTLFQGSPPTATFSAATSWSSGCPVIQPSSYRWEVTNKITGQTHQKTTSSSNTDTSGWTPPLTLNSNSNYDIKVTIICAGVTWPAGCNPTENNPFITPDVPPPPPNSFSWCCFLIIAWMIVNTIFGVMLYYGVPFMWPVGTIISIVVGAIATILLGIWLFLCCGKCALKFWRCCVLWQWQFIGVSWIGIIFGLLEVASKWVPILGGNRLVLGIYSTLAGAIALILAIAECGRLPNPFDPSTWPACCCSEGKCI